MNQAWIDYIDALPDITPDALFDAAQQDKDCPFRDQFEWDVETGWRKHNLEVARRILRLRVNIVVDEEQLDVPAYVRDPSREPKEQGFVRTDVLRRPTEQERRNAVIAAELDRAIASLKRAQQLKAALGQIDPKVERRFSVAMHMASQLANSDHKQPPAAQ